MRTELYLVSGLLLAVLLSAIAVAVVKHDWRKNFIRLQALQASEDASQVEWGRLQLEEGARSAHGFIEQLARERLHMHPPRADEIQVLVTN